MIRVWCDGSGTHAGDSPACIGVVVEVDGEVICETSECVGIGTNNVAELRAVRRALVLVEHIGGVTAPAVIHTDSQYAIGVVSMNWWVQKNLKLVATIREHLSTFMAVRFEHVRGHSGIYGNELADWLAWRARKVAFIERGIQLPERARPEPGQGASDGDRSGGRRRHRGDAAQGPRQRFRGPRGVVGK